MRKQMQVNARKWIASLLLFVFTTQPALAFAATTADAAADANHKPVVHDGPVPVIDIAAPNKQGISHNLYTDFNVGTGGLVLNNAAQAAATTLAGNIQANANFKGAPASLIINEVTGSNRTNLNGMIEIAGNRADLIIANPNGITGNGFGFINANRVTLATGKPQLDAAGNLASFRVNSGDLAIEGSGLDQQHAATKLDILSRAAKINAEVWTSNDLNLVTGNNEISYADLKTKEIAGKEAAKPAVALDVGAVGGMYAGKIMLVGTEKGLGVNVDGTIVADKALTISTEGKLSIEGHINAAENIAVHAATGFSNQGQLTSKAEISIKTKGDAQNTGFIIAGEALEDEDGAPAPAAKPAPAGLTLEAGDHINSTGMLSATKEIALSAGKIKYEKGNTQAPSVVIKESNPDTAVVVVQPPTALKDKDIVTPVLPIKDAAGTVVVTKAVAKESDLALVADASAGASDKPIVDKTASGIDLVQIATPNAQGLSRNLYTDFNVKPGGIILNNATAYANTQLAGYIDYNTRLGGVAAKTILNEVTSARASKLNGFIEVAGHKANVIIANPNGIQVNGAGFINADHATLATASAQNWLSGAPSFASGARGSVFLVGDGVNAATTQQLNLVTNDLYNNASEIWAHDLNIAADGNIYNTGKMAASNAVQVAAKNLTNEKQAVLNSGGKMAVALSEDLVNDKATIHSHTDQSLQMRSLKNQNDGALYSGKDLQVAAATMENNHSQITASAHTAIKAKEITNKAAAGLFIDGDADLQTDQIVNQNATIAINGKSQFTVKDFKNIDQAVLYSGGDLKIQAENTLLNQSSLIESQGNIQVLADKIVNEKTLFHTDWTITHQDIAYGISPLPGHYSASRHFDREIKTGTIKEETPAAHIAADKDITLESGDLVNHYSEVTAGHDLNIQTKNLENFGYQGTIITTDTGNDLHNWKYKHHRRFHIGCHDVYGTTVIPYYAQMVEDEQTARPGILSGVHGVKIQADTTKNITYDAVKNTLTERPQALKVPMVKNVNLLLGDLRLDGGMFKLHAEPTAKYLIETNPQFANYKNFLSSDYLLQRVKSDPEKVSKRLGDGYYEQKFVMEQITQLTGRKYLGDYSSDLEQYKALMDQGAVVAKAYNLTVGVGLTKEQMAALTTDIVWLVEKKVDNQTVLVPEIYLSALKQGDLKNTGALIIGGDIDLVTSGDLKNIGTIKADKTLHLQQATLQNEAGTIAGKDIAIKASGTVENAGGEISGDAVNITAKDIINRTTQKTEKYRELTQIENSSIANIQATGDITLTAENSIKNQGAILAAGKDVTLSANKDIAIETLSQERHVAVAYGKSSAQEDIVRQTQSGISGSNIHLSGQDITIKGSALQAQNTVDIKAQGDINLVAAKDSTMVDASVGNRGGEYFDRQKDSNETVVSGTIYAGKDSKLEAGKDINIKGSTIKTQTGLVAAKAQGNLTIANETEHHESLHEEHREKTGFFSSTKTDIYDHKINDTVVGSEISGGQIQGKAEQDLTVTGSSVIADGKVQLEAGKNLKIQAAEEKSQSEYEKRVKKSGLLSGGGLGITIGSQKEKDQLKNQSVEQIKSTIGSLGDNVTLMAGDSAAVKASDVIAKKDIAITAKDVSIESADNAYTSQEKHEFKQTGLTISLGGEAIKAAQSIAAPLQRAEQVKDDRLKALYAYKANEAMKDAKAKGDLAKMGRISKNDLSLSVSFGSKSEESQSNSTSKLAQGSHVDADGNVAIQATQGNIDVKGSDITGKNIALDAKKNVNITAGENSNKTTSESHNSDAGFGVSFSTAGLTGVELHSNKQNDAVKENTTTYKASTVTAKDTLDLHSGEDTNILGSKASGDKVKVKVEGNLNLESLQDKDTYEEKSDSSGFGISSNIKHPEAGKTGGNVLDTPNYSGSVSKGNIDSDYNSVTKQAEIHAGQGGFAIEVGKNTDLKGAVISSDATPDKNKISTGTLTYSDIQNKAEYSADNSGISFETATTNKTKKVNGEETVVREKGITKSVDIGMPVKGSASSITKSAIAEGTIQVREGNTDFSNLSRDTKGAINALGKIFDKEKVQEKQELTKIFGQEAYKAIGDLSSREYLKALSDAAKADAAADKKAYNEAMARAESWKDGGTKKNLLHAVAGGIMSSLGGGSFTSGATAAGVNEAVQNELAKIKDPGLHQLVSAVIGAAASKLVGGSAQAGASAAGNGTKYNFLAHPEQLKFAVLLEKALANNDKDEIINIITYYTAKSSYNIGNATLDDLLAMRQKEVIDGKLYEQLVNLINVKNNGSLNYTLNELSTTVYGPKAAFRANAYKDILDGNSSYDPFITPPEVELQLQQEHYASLVANDAAAKEAERAASPGDYAYKHENAQIVGTYPDGTPAVHLEDGDYPVYSLPKQEIVESDEANEPANGIIGTIKEGIKQYDDFSSQQENTAAEQLARSFLKMKHIDPDDPNNAEILAVEIENAKKMDKQSMEAVTGSVGGASFKTFRELKAYLGSPGVGKQWHHIVEQAQINASRAGFSPEEVNTVENIISLQSGKESVHSAISAYYSSKQWFSEGLTVRNWLSTKTFQEQFEFGMDYLKSYGEVIKENGKWIFKPFE